MKIDSHNHFWQYDPVRHDWIDESMKVIRKDFYPEGLKLVLQSNDIQGTVAVQADQTEDVTIFLLGLASQHDFIKGVVGWVDLRADDIIDRLERFSKNEKLVGFRHVVQGEPDPNFMLLPDFQNGLSLLSGFDFTYDILILPHQLPAALETVRRFPNQKFVIDHLAKPNIKDGEFAEWEKLMRAIGSYENVYCKLSGMVTEADWNNWKQEDFKYCLDVVFDAFGTNRLMFGSDWPVCLLAAEYAEVRGILDEYIKDFSESDKSAIYGKNAIDFYNLKV